VEFDGHRCIEIAAGAKGGGSATYFFVAPDLKNLVIAIQTTGPQDKVLQRLRHESLEVPDSLFEIPEGFKSAERVKWSRVAAKVSYGGKPAERSRVFRAANGDMLIWVEGGYYNWYYLYLPREKSVHLVNADYFLDSKGMVIEFSHEGQVYSSEGYASEEEAEMDPHLEVRANGIRFRSNRYQDGKEMVDVGW